VTTVSVEELKEKYAVLDIPPYGDCIIVPGDAFNPDWEVCLGDEGYNCIDDVLDGQPVTFVQLKKVENKEVEKTEKVESKKRGYALRGPNWSKADDKTLLETYDALVAQGKKYGSHKILAKMFKGRSESAISQRLKRLLKKREKQRQKTGEDSKSTKDVSVEDAVDAMQDAVDKFKLSSFEEIWIKSGQVGTDLKQRAEAFYNAAVKAKLPGPIIDSVISVFCEMDALRDYYDNREGKQEEFDGALKKTVESLAKKLVEHKHAVGSGEAMLPMEA